MSSFATAPSRKPEQESQNLKPQPQSLAEPDAAPAVASPAPTQPQHGEASTINSSQTLDEMQRVERLLAQLEARSMALVPYGFGNLREVPAPRKSKTPLVAGVLVAAWLTLMILGIAYIRYVGHSPFSSDREANTTPIAITPDPAPTGQKTADSVDRLAQALVSSSERMNQLQAAVEKSNRDLQKIAVKVNTDHSTEATSVPVTEQKDAPVSEPKPPKSWHKVLDVKPTESAIAHKGPDGTVDYWIVPRGVDTPQAKVLPIGTSTDGVIIHNLEDGKDYTITPAGEWRNESVTASSGN